MNENLDVCIGVHVDGFLTDSRSEVSISRRIYSEINRLDQEKHCCNLVPGAMLLPWICDRCRIGVHRTHELLHRSQADTKVTDDEASQS